MTELEQLAQWHADRGIYLAHRARAAESPEALTGQSANHFAVAHHLRAIIVVAPKIEITSVATKAPPPDVRTPRQRRV